MFVEEGVAEGITSGKTLSKHCVTCRGVTEWAYVTIDRRQGHDRRSSDRRNEQNPDPPKSSE